MTELLNHAVYNFKNSFTNCRKLFQDENHQNGLSHAGEFGRYRENICKDFLQQFLPNHMKISDGFILNKNGNLSTQADLVIYDSDNTPKLERSGARFFPTETTYAIGEIKSVLNWSDLIGAVEKIRETKKLRQIPPSNYYPIRPINLMREIDYTLLNWQNIKYIHYDCTDIFNLKEDIEILRDKIECWESELDQFQDEKDKDEDKDEYEEKIKTNREILSTKIENFNIGLIYNLRIFEEMNLVSFIICERIKDLENKWEDNSSKLVRFSFEDEPFNFNVILSIEDGIIYHQQTGRPYPFPMKRNQKSGTVFLKADANNSHIKLFLSLILEALNKTSGYEFNAASYLFKNIEDDLKDKQKLRARD